MNIAGKISQWSKGANGHLHWQGLDIEQVGAAFALEIPGNGVSHFDTLEDAIRQAEKHVNQRT